MEEKKKNNKGFIIVIILLVLIICGLVGYILYNKSMIDNKEKNVKEEKKDVVKEVKDVDKYKENLSLLSEKIFQYDKESLKNSELEGQDLIYVLSNIGGKSITEITGSELKTIAKENFGVDNLELVGIKCGMNHPAGESDIMLIYNSNTDKYEFNPEHPGHGGGSRGASFYLGDGKASTDGDFYKYTSNIYFYKTCSGDTCGPIENMNIYLTYKDLDEGINKVMDATSNDKLCQQAEFGYSCDFDAIYNAIKDKTKTISFYYKLVNDKLVFDRYEFN